ncbi:hypothetical protein [Lacticaseibacillus zhaodongensis]|uniref:hypothetical protein n=1 Tax=Lacticaseibacillus zhaodongensis TaxID=2668065 RepID=UPI0012D32BD7|nr:hypothetical protein [Lacticaseibacillus zhaodongensis]
MESKLDVFLDLLNHWGMRELYVQQEQANREAFNSGFDEFIGRYMEASETRKPIAVPPSVASYIAKLKHNHRTLIEVFGIIYNAESTCTGVGPGLVWIKDHQEQFAEAWVHGCKGDDAK